MWIESGPPHAPLSKSMVSTGVPVLNPAVVLAAQLILVFTEPDPGTFVSLIELPTDQGVTAVRGNGVDLGSQVLQVAAIDLDAVGEEPLDGLEQGLEGALLMPFVGPQRVGLQEPVLVEVDHDPTPDASSGPLDSEQALPVEPQVRVTRLAGVVCLFLFDLVVLLLGHGVLQVDRDWIRSSLDCQGRRVSWERPGRARLRASAQRESSAPGLSATASCRGPLPAHS